MKTIENLLRYTSSGLTVLLVFFIASCHGDKLPDIPEKHLPSLTTIPPQGEVILETRIDAKSGQVEIGIFNLTDGSESTWDLPAKILTPLGNKYAPYDQRSSWAPQTGQFLLGLFDAIYLISRDGRHAEIHLRMPGKIAPYDGMHNYALTRSGQFVAYSLYTRDRNDAQQDAHGKLYTDLMYQKIEGSEPARISSDGYIFLPDWSPDGSKIAFTTKKEDNLVISDINGQVLSSIEPAFKVRPSDLRTRMSEIRWEPSGNRLAFIYNGKLYMVNVDGSNLRALEFQGFDEDIRINSFAWAPSGNRFVFRSTYKAGEICSYHIDYLLGPRPLPCIQGYHLFTSNIDGSKLKRITSDPEYRKSELHWIQ
jgi:Tol biopolymer transport system component